MCNLPNRLFDEPPPIAFKPDETHCPVCGRCLCILRTRKERRITAIGIGTFIAHETTMYCPQHPDIGSFKSAELPMIVPPGSNFAYNVLVEVGKLRFNENRQVAEIQTILLERHAIKISASEVEVLINNFLFYLTAVHQQNNHLIKQYIEKQGGYILHLDATCEGDSPKLVSSIDPLSGFVLYSAKLKSENKDDLGGFLEEIKKRLGVPLVVVSDMADAIKSAVKDVFGDIAHYICHFHFLKAIGLTLFDDECSTLRKALSKVGILGKLKTMRLKMGSKLSDITMSKIEAFIEEPEQFGKALFASELSVYYLILWILDYGSDADGYGFPFDHRHLNFYVRLRTAYSIVKEANLLYSVNNTNRNILWKLHHEIKEIVEDSALEKTIEKYEEKLSVFSKLRDALGTVPRDVNNGLCQMKETGTHAELRTIKRAVANFKTDLRKTIKATDDKSLGKSFQRILDKLKEQRKRLFSDPLTVYVDGEKRTIFILRTNNILEQHFRRFNYWCRRIHGNRSVRRNLENIPEQFPMVENLKNPNYVQLIFGDDKNIAEQFAKVDKDVITEMRNNLRTKQKIHASNKIKKTIRNPDFGKLLMASFASAAS